MGLFQHSADRKANRKRPAVGDKELFPESPQPIGAVGGVLTGGPVFPLQDAGSNMLYGASIILYVASCQPAAVEKEA